MSGFKFNFSVSDDQKDQNSNGEVVNCKHIDSSGDCDALLVPANELPWIPLAELQAELEAVRKIDCTFGSHHLQILSGSSVEEYLLKKQGQTTCPIISAISSHSDLVAGLYEGGLKLWECSLDLCHYLTESNGMNFTGGLVLELGCGGGVPGLLAAKLGASRVHFQDFNKEVLELYTMPNVQLNNIANSCSFFTGDWGSFAVFALSRNLKYDVILTSETIYKTSSYPKLKDIFTSLLSSSGFVLIAAKSIYFGVGGSVATFVDYIESTQQFAVEVVKQIDADLPRQILKLTKKSFYV